MRSASASPRSSATVLIQYLTLASRNSARRRLAAKCSTSPSCLLLDSQYVVVNPNVKSDGGAVMQRTKKIVINAWRFFFFCFVVVILGCGNSELESKIYERYQGEIPCWCCEPIKIGPDYSNCSEGFKSALLKAGAYEYPKYVNKLHPISEVSSRKSKMDHIWIVTVKAKCPTASTGIIERIEEYSYRHGKISLVKKISPYWCYMTER